MYMHKANKNMEFGDDCVLLMYFEDNISEYMAGICGRCYYLLMLL